jgi:hypothetical protein
VGTSKCSSGPSGLVRLAAPGHACVQGGRTGRAPGPWPCCSGCVRTAAIGTRRHPRQPLKWLNAGSRAPGGAAVGARKWLPLGRINLPHCRRHGTLTHLEVLQWARANGCPCHAGLYAAEVAQFGHLAVLQPARANGCPWDATICKRAAAGGHLLNCSWRVQTAANWGARPA